MEQEEKQEPLKVGIIGTGFGSVVQYPGFVEHPGFEPVAIAGRHHSKTATIAKRLGVAHHFTNWRELLEMEELDVVSICTPPHLHHEMTIESLKAGKHILCEKPLSTNLAHAQEMQDHVEESGLIAMVDLVFRYIPSRAYMVELIKNGYLGDIYQFDITVRNASRLNPRTRGYNWWSSLKQGGGVLNALGAHYIDFLFQIFDKIDGVSGMTATHIPKRLNKLTGRMKTVSADDAFISLFDIGQDCLASMNISSTTPFGRGPRIEVFGSEGTLVMLEDQTLIGGKIGEDDELKHLEIPENLRLDLKTDPNHLLVPPFIKLLDEFQKSVKTGRSLHPNFEDGLKVQRVLDAIRQSTKQHKWVDLRD